MAKFNLARFEKLDAAKDAKAKVAENSPKDKKLDAAAMKKAKGKKGR